MSKKKRTLLVEVLHGPEGDALLINNYRFAGPKTWGGGTVTQKWVIDLEELETQLKEFKKTED